MEENKIQENFQEENFENEMDNQIDNVIENETENIVKDTQEEQTFSETTNTTSESETSEEEIDIETIREMLGEVRRIPERVKTERKYYEEEEEEEEDREEQEIFDFTLISDALYNVYAQGLKWATYTIISRIAPGLEARVIRELHFPSSARKQITNAINKVLQKRFSQWAIKLSEEGTLFALLMLYSTTYITQAVILAYHLKATQNTNISNNQTQNENTTEKPKRRRGRPPKKQKTETTEDMQA